MPEQSLYQMRKALGLCTCCGRQRANPAHRLCEACTQHKQAWLEAHRPRYNAQSRDRMRARAEARRLAPATNMLACCGRWHPIAQVPYTTLCCGRTYFSEKDSSDAA